MFVKYPKTFRIPVPEIDVSGKFMLLKEEWQLLLGGNVTIEEKMDGANVGIQNSKTRGIVLQKRNSLVERSEHEQFSFFHSWARDRYLDLVKIPFGWIVYGELLRCVHSIYYDRLPDWVLVYDVLAKKAGEPVWLNRQEREEFCRSIGLHCVPLVTEGHYERTELSSVIPKASAFGEMSEGIVVKRYHKKHGYLKGKVVKAEFIKFLDDSEHWKRKPVRYNVVLDKEKAGAIL